MQSFAFKAWLRVWKQFNIDQRESLLQYFDTLSNDMTRRDETWEMWTGTEQQRMHDGDEEDDGGDDDA